MGEAGTVGMAVPFFCSNNGVAIKVRQGGAVGEWGRVCIWGNGLGRPQVMGK